MLSGLSATLHVAGVADGRPIDAAVTLIPDEGDVP
jgi:hypothetical protein